jgi:hypothetical protein
VVNTKEIGMRPNMSFEKFAAVLAALGTSAALGCGGAQPQPVNANEVAPQGPSVPAPDTKAISAAATEPSNATPSPVTAPPPATNAAASTPPAEAAAPSPASAEEKTPAAAASAAPPPAKVPAAKATAKKPAASKPSNAEASCGAGTCGGDAKKKVL